MIVELVQARGTGRIHLTPGELHGLWRLTQAAGRAFWHMTPAAQCILVGAPGLSAVVWLARWDPLAGKAARGKRKRWRVKARKP